MSRLIKWTLIITAIFAIWTATPAEQASMYSGVRAFGDAVVNACTRRESVCTQMIAAGQAVLKQATAAQSDREGPRQHTGHTPATPEIAQRPARPLHRDRAYEPERR
jgi:hypothetical protein